MDSPQRPLECHICAYENPAIDADLERRGFCHGMVQFAIPTLGILFRCRAQGKLLDLEFAAMFSLLKFLRDKLKDEKIKQVQIMSSNPEFVFSFTADSKHLHQNEQRRRMLVEYRARFELSLGFVKPINNRALTPAAEYPSLPDGRSVGFGPHSDPAGRPSFKPFQRGIRL